MTLPFIYTFFTQKLYYTQSEYTGSVYRLKKYITKLNLPFNLPSLDNQNVFVGDYLYNTKAKLFYNNIINFINNEYKIFQK